MINTDFSNSQVFLAIGVTDMRKSINGLSLIVEEHFESDALSGDLFVFCNRRRDMVKILYWNRNGFCLWLKRLEQDLFQWPESEREVMKIDKNALNWLLHGLDIERAHQKISNKTVS